MTVKRPALLVAALALLGTLALGADTAARAANEENARTAQAQPADVATPAARRARSHVRIYRAPLAWPYPRPGYYSWPGRNAVRRCVDWYALENRASGRVVTPQMRCWWARG